MSKKRGRPEHVPDRKSRKFVEEMSAAGILQDEIARVVGIGVVTLRKHYRAELDTATARLTVKLAGKLFERACGMEDGPAVTAAIFWLKARGGWTDKPAGPAGAAGVPLDAVDTWGGESSASVPAEVDE